MKITKQMIKRTQDAGEADNKANKTYCKDTKINKPYLISAEEAKNIPDPLSDPLSFLS